MESADLVFEIASHSHPVEVSGGVPKAFLGSHVCHLSMSDVYDFTSNVVSFMGCFIENIWTVSTVILLCFKEKFIDEDRTKVIGVLVDDVKESICSWSLAKRVVPFAFEVLREQEGANIKGSGGLVRKRVIISDRSVWDWEVFIRGYMV